MHLLIASDSFKGSLTSLDFAQIVKDTLIEISNQIRFTCLEVGDGGEGTSLALIQEFKADCFQFSVTGVYGEKREVVAYSYQNFCYVDVAQVVGLAEVAESNRKPLFSSTIGLGDLINRIESKGFEELILCCGGSASIDGGIGLLHALGVKFYDKHHNLLRPIGESLSMINRIDHTDIKSNLRITALVDVENPLTGTFGAAHCFGKQKGASGQEIEILDEGLLNFAAKTEEMVNSSANSNSYGMGAAGGIPFALKYYLGAEVKSGFDFYSDQLNLEEKIKNVDLVITGEGRLDEQSFMGKVVGQINELCQKHNKPCIIFCGSKLVEDSVLESQGIKYAYSILRDKAVEELVSNIDLTSLNLELTIKEVMPSILAELS